MYINYEKIGKFLGFGQKFFYELKIAQNCAYIKKNIKQVKKKLKGKHPIIVAFYVYDDTKWKSQSVYDLMMSDEKFEPYIFVTKCNAPKDNCNYQTNKDYEKVYNFFINRNMRVIRGYDTDKERFIPFAEMTPQPDIIIYQHPWYVETSQGPVVCSKFALTYYIPYFIATTNMYIEYDLRFHQYVYKHYILNDLIKQEFAKKMRNKADNVVVVGHPQLDEFYLDKTPEESKYVIYAPHWSVCGNNIRLSTFDWSGKIILEFASNHPELNWVFKPHPVLYNFLYTSGFMTKEEADDYYKKWSEIGVVNNSGGYLNLFKKSRALITDCGSFLTEYLLTEKPCIHLISKDGAEFNEMVKKISKSYYQAFNIVDLENYLNSVIIDNFDIKKNERLRTLSELNFRNTRCARNIINDILKDVL